MKIQCEYFFSDEFPILSIRLFALDFECSEVVSTNTLGLMICCREVKSIITYPGIMQVDGFMLMHDFPQAMNMMLAQPRGGHIFNIDGAGSDGRPTPRSDIFFTQFSDAIFLIIFVPLSFHISLSLISFYQICCVWSY